MKFEEKKNRNLNAFSKQNKNKFGGFKNCNPTNFVHVRNELCHNQILCFIDTKKVTIFGNQFDLVTEVNDLTNLTTIQYLISLLNIAQR